MTVEIVFGVVVVSLVFNIIGFWALSRWRDHQLQVVRRIWDRLNYLELGMSYHGMIPMPWEAEKTIDQINTFKREGNVVYLPKE